jgi:hypothetical protein
MTAAAVFLAAWGCGPSASTEVVVEPEPPAAYAPDSASQTGFDRAVLAALAASRLDEANVAALWSETTTPGRQEAALKAIEPHVKDLKSALGSAWSLPSAARRPADSLTWQQGWLRIAHAVRLEGEQGSGDDQVRAARTLAMLAGRIASLSAADLTLAQWMTNEAARLARQGMPTASPEALQSLSEASTEAGTLADDMEAIVSVEMAGISHDLDRVEARAKGRRAEELADWGVPAKKFLRILDRSGPPERDKLMSAVRAEVRAYADWARTAVRKPAAEEGDYKDSRPKLSNVDRTWSGLNMALATPLLSTPAAYRTLLGRLRLLAAEAGVLAMVKRSGQAPEQLPESLRKLEDPFTLAEFAYRAEGDAFKVYSFGRDGKNDAGATDEAGESPDFVLAP